MAAEKTSTPKIKKVQKSALSLDVIDMKGAVVGSVNLPEGIFDVTASDRLLAQYVRVYLANQRQGTAKTKTRGEVKASTKKIYRQKGTGRARHGAKTAPIFVGGGVAHGVKLRSFTLKLNKKQRTKALYYSLTLKRKDSSINVVKGLEGVVGKTKEAIGVLSAIGLADSKKAMFVYGNKEKNEGFLMGLQNIGTIKLAECHLINAYDVMNATKIIFSEEALREFIEFRGFN